MNRKLVMFVISATVSSFVFAFIMYAGDFGNLMDIDEGSFTLGLMSGFGVITGLSGFVRFDDPKRKQKPPNFGGG